MKITAYEVHEGVSNGWGLHPAERKREWMSANNSHAYHCLPLVVANHLGWVIDSPVGFTAEWNGNKHRANTQIQFDEKQESWVDSIQDHFGNGIITFRLPWLFQTDEQVGLLVRGPTNQWKENAHPLDGFIETWWLPAGFTMNWKIIQPNVSVRFEKGEPICHIMPFHTPLLESSEAEIRMLSSDPELQTENKRWSFVRQMVNNLDAEGRKKIEKFNKKYTKGQDYLGVQEETHQKQVFVPEFVDKRTTL